MMKSKIRITLILILITSVAIVFGQKNEDEKDDYKQFEFGPVPDSVTIPEEFLNEHAVTTFQEITIQNDFDAEYYNKLASYTNETNNFRFNYLSKYTEYSGIMNLRSHARVKILTKKGLEDYSFASIPNYESLELTILDARTIKPDGTVIDLDKEDIVEVETPLSYDDETDLIVSEQKRFAIPGVEVGDIIEYVYELKYRNLLLVDEIFFHKDLPVILSKLTVKLRSGLYARLYYYNGAEHAESYVDGNFLTYSWESKNLPGYSNDQYARESMELPFVLVALKEITYKSDFKELHVQVIPDSWNVVFNDIYKHRIENNSDRMARSGTVKRVISEIKEQNPESSKFDQFYKFFRYVNDSVEVRDLEDWEVGYKPGYYLHKKFISHRQLYPLYIKAFEEFDIDYRLCLAADKHDMQIDTSVVSPFYFNNYLFRLNFDDLSLYLYPSTEYRKYELDEIPIQVEATRAFLVPEPGSGEDYSYAILPQGTETDNFTNRRIMINLDLDSTHYSFESKNTLSGAISTRYRHFIDKNLLTYKTDSIDILRNFMKKHDEEEEYELDTVYKTEFQHVYPYKYMFNYEGTAKNIVNQLDDSTFTIPLNSIINNKILPYSNVQRRLNFIPDYPFSDLQSVIIQFNEPVKLLNADNLMMKVKNEIGIYHLNVRQINPNMILVKSDYKVQKNFIETEKYNNLVEISSAAEDAENQTLILQH
jgi:hypothetical protein